MIRKSPTNSARAGVTRRSFAAGAGAAGLLAGTAPFNIVRAQGGPLKVGVLLPRSGVQAGIGQDCKRGADIAPALFKQIGYTAADRDHDRRHRDQRRGRARPRREADRRRRAAAGRRLRFRADHGDRPGRRAEGHPVRHQHRRGAADHRAGLQVRVPQLPDRADDPRATPSPTRRRSSRRPARRRRPVVFMHVNDTFGTAMQRRHRRASCRSFNMPYKIVETIAYDPAARDLSVEVAKAKATGADALLMVSRLNDAILLTREMVKQRWSPMGILSMGPGWYEEQYPQDAGQARRTGRISFVPWYDPNKKMTKSSRRTTRQEALSARSSCRTTSQHRLHLRGADGVPPMPTSAPARPIRKALADAIRTTNIDDNGRSVAGHRVRRQGPEHHRCRVCLQNRGGRRRPWCPKEPPTMTPVFPMPSWNQRG